MAKLTWETREYETGLDRGVFYPQDGTGEVWNGLITIQESPSDADENIQYLDGVKTRSRRKSGSFSGTIEAFFYPESFFDKVLLQRRPKAFGLSYRVLTRDSYKIHLVYNVLTAPSGFSNQQLGTDSFSWGFTTLPLPIPGGSVSAHLIIDASKAYSWTISALEDVLYGNDINDARLPLPDEVLNIFDVNSILQVIDNGDGSFTVIGPDDVVQMLDLTTFQIDWPSAVYIDTDSYTISSL